MVDDEEFQALSAEVARLRALVEQLYYRSGSTMPADDGISVDAPPSDIVDLVRENRLIEAIKHWRERTGTGLAEAKAAIDEIARRTNR